MWFEWGLSPISSCIWTLRPWLVALFIGGWGTFRVQHWGRTYRRVYSPSPLPVCSLLSVCSWRSDLSALCPDHLQPCLCHPKPPLPSINNSFSNREMHLSIHLQYKPRARLSGHHMYGQHSPSQGLAQEYWDSQQSGQTDWKVLSWEVSQLLLNELVWHQHLPVG